MFLISLLQETGLYKDTQCFRLLLLESLGLPESPQQRAVPPPWRAFPITAILGTVWGLASCELDIKS